MCATPSILARGSDNAGVGLRDLWVRGGAVCAGGEMGWGSVRAAMGGGSACVRGEMGRGSVRAATSGVRRMCGAGQRLLCGGRRLRGGLVCVRGEARGGLARFRVAAGAAGPAGLRRRGCCRLAGLCSGGWCRFVRCAPGRPGRVRPPASAAATTVTLARARGRSRARGRAATGTSSPATAAATPPGSPPSPSADCHPHLRAAGRGDFGRRSRSRGGDFRRLSRAPVHRVHTLRRGDRDSDCQWGVAGSGSWQRQHRRRPTRPPGTPPAETVHG